MFLGGGTPLWAPGSPRRMLLPLEGVSFSGDHILGRLGEGLSAVAPGSRDSSALFKGGGGGRSRAQGLWPLAAQGMEVGDVDGVGVPCPRLVCSVGNRAMSLPWDVVGAGVLCF